MFDHQPQVVKLGLVRRTDHSSEGKGKEERVLSTKGQKNLEECGGGWETQVFSIQWVSLGLF